MESSLSKNIAYLKGGFSQDPLLFYGSLYLLFLLGCKTNIVTLLNAFGYPAYVITLLPFVFFYRLDRKRSHANAPITHHLSSEKYFTKKQRHDFYQAIPTQEIDTLDNVMLPALIIFKKTLLEMHDDPSRAFDDCVEDTCKTLLNTSKNATLFNQYIHWRRDRAILLFHFLATLKDHYVKQKLDVALLIKRLPQSLFQCLGHEKYRLFELGHFLLSDEDPLINHECAALLKTTGSAADPIRPTTVDRNPKAHDHTIASEYKQEKKVEAIQKAENDKKDTQEKFIAWLAKKIQSGDKRFKINESGWVYHNALQFGDETLFVSEAALEHYCAIKGEKLRHLKNVFSTEKPFRADFNHQAVTVYQIKPITIAEAVFASVHIEEGSP